MLCVAYDHDDVVPWPSILVALDRKSHSSTHNTWQSTYQSGKGSLEHHKQYTVITWLEHWCVMICTELGSMIVDDVVVWCLMPGREWLTRTISGIIDRSSYYPSHFNLKVKAKEATQEVGERRRIWTEYCPSRPKKCTITRRNNVLID